MIHYKYPNHLFYCMTLVCVEGVDALGKSTLIKGLKTKYSDAIFTREPYCYDEVQKLVQRKDSYYKIILYMADRYQHNKELLIPNKDKLIFCDRYWMSNLIYQSAELSGQNDGEEFTEERSKIVKMIKKMHLPGLFVKPDLTIVLYTLGDRAVKQRMLNEVNGDETKYKMLCNLNMDYLYNIDDYINVNKVKYILVDGLNEAQVLEYACKILKYAGIEP